MTASTQAIVGGHLQNRLQVSVAEEINDHKARTGNLPYNLSLDIRRIIMTGNAIFALKVQCENYSDSS